MDARLQRRIQRYGWDLAATDYEPLWRVQLAAAQTRMLAGVALAPGERVLDVASGTGLVAFDAARAVGAAGEVVGVDLSGEMVLAARRRADESGVTNVSFVRMDAEHLDLADASFDVALCALGLMFLADPAVAVREMRRVLRPGGRLGLAVWGERSQCGWSAMFPIVEAEVSSDVCPLFFQLGQKEALARLCVDAQLENVEQHRIAATLTYENADDACNAAFVGGPVALAWSRFDDETRARVRRRYIEALRPWRHGRGGYWVPGQFVVVTATVPDD